MEHQEKNWILAYTKNSTSKDGLMNNFVDSTGRYARITTFMKDIGTDKMALIEDRLQQKIAKEFPKEDDCFVAEQSLKIVLAQTGTKAREALREKMKNGGVERVPMIEAEPIVEATVIPDDLPPLHNRAIEEFGDVIGRADERQAIQIAKKLLPFSNITPEQLLAETDGDAPTAIAAWGLLYFAR